MAKDRVTLGTAIKLALACLVVGLLLAALNVTPGDLWARVSGIALGLWAAAQGLLGWAGSYMLLGALVVLPIWLILYLWGRMSRGRD